MDPMPPAETAAHPSLQVGSCGRSEGHTLWAHVLPRPLTSNTASTHQLLVQQRLQPWPCCIPCTKPLELDPCLWVACSKGARPGDGYRDHAGRCSSPDDATISCQHQAALTRQLVQGCHCRQPISSDPMPRTWRQAAATAHGASCSQRSHGSSARQYHQGRTSSMSNTKTWHNAAGNDLDTITCCTRGESASAPCACNTRCDMLEMQRLCMRCG
jgi:hypothetical protein